MPPRPRCQTCGSKKWHKDSVSGLIVCSEGHVLQDYRNETNQVEEMSKHAMKKRRLKKGKKAEQSRADPKLYHGSKGRFHFLLCLQLLLRKQIAAVTTLWKLPPEFELICRDLWAMHLSLFAEAVPAEGYDAAEDDGSRKDKGDEDAGKEKNVESNESGNDDEEEVADELDENQDEDPVLEALMEENSEDGEDELISSDDEEAGTRLGEQKNHYRGKNRREGEGIMSTLAVLVLGCWTLRVPIMYRDIYRAVESFEIPYLDGLRWLPQEMVEHLRKQDRKGLSPGHGPDTMVLHGMASRLGKKLYERYGIYTPEVNAGPLLWRLVKTIGGTPVLYWLAKRLASELGLPLTVHGSLAPKQRQGGGRQTDNVPAEVMLMAVVVIVLKMEYGLDGTARRRSGIGGCLGSEAGMLAAIGRGEKTIDSREDGGVANMDEDETEAYIGFCSRVLGTEESDRFFPVTPGGDGDYGRGRVGGGVDGGAAEDVGCVPAGCLYKAWGGVSAVSDSYRTVIERAGVIVGADVGSVVGRLERQMTSDGRSRGSCEW